MESDGITLIVTHENHISVNSVQLQGTIHLNGKDQASQGAANIAMWSKVKGNYYFSKLPNLQGISSRDPIKFSIPFSSPKEFVTEVVLEVELPQGGEIKFRDLSVTKG